jgi:hypothetical protein
VDAGTSAAHLFTLPHAQVCRAQALKLGGRVCGPFASWECTSPSADLLLLTAGSLKAQLLQDEKAPADPQAEAFAVDRHAKTA